MGVIGGLVAPDPPFASDLTQFTPTYLRVERSRRLSASASPELRLSTNTVALKRAMQAMGVNILAWQKTAALTVRAWVPAGTLMDWGDSATETPGADGFLTHVYAGAGVYNVLMSNATWKSQGQAVVQV